MGLTFFIQSSLLSSRVLFNPFNAVNDKDPQKNKVGIRVHTWIGALVCDILAKLGLASGTLAAKINGQTLYLNRKSFKKWCRRHESEWMPNEDIVAKVQTIANLFIHKQEEQAKAKAAEQQAKQERIKKIQDIALKHLQEMTSICYNLDGKLNTELWKGHFMYDILKRETFFTKHEEDPKHSLESTIKDKAIDYQAIFYHGTTPSIADKIKQEGFDPLAPTVTGTDSGAGTYFTHQKDKALNYAKGDEKGLLACRIKPNIKIAHLDQKVRECFDQFKGLVSRYVKRYEEAIKEDVNNLGIEASIGMEIEPRLWGLFVRDFFLRLGYRGLYTEYSGLAGCSYLNLFDPKEDIIKIE